MCILSTVTKVDWSCAALASPTRDVLAAFTCSLSAGAPGLMVVKCVQTIVQMM